MDSPYIWHLLTGCYYCHRIRDNRILSEIIEYEKGNIYIIRQAKFNNVFDIILKAFSSNILGDGDPAIMMGAFLSNVCALESERLLTFLNDNNIGIKILGQNPNSPRVEKVARNVQVKSNTFHDIKIECLKLRKIAPDSIEFVDFSHDIEDYSYQGIFVNNSKKPSLSIHWYQDASIGKEGIYEIVTHQEIKNSVDVFKQLESLYSKEIWM